MSLKDKPKKNKKLFENFVYDLAKITGIVPGWIAYRFKIDYEEESAMKKVKDGDIIIANHIHFCDPVTILDG